MSKAKRLDRPKICRDCSRYETDCQGSNQEDCARLDRPDREKIAKFLIDYDSKSWLTASLKLRECYRRIADQILALFTPSDRPELRELSEKLEEPRAVRMLAEWLAIDHDETRLQYEKYMADGQELYEYITVIIKMQHSALIPDKKELREQIIREEINFLVDEATKVWSIRIEEAKKLGYQACAEKMSFILPGKFKKCREEAKKPLLKEIKDLEGIIESLSNK